jgi:hypothetical protein
MYLSLQIVVKKNKRTYDTIVSKKFINSQWLSIHFFNTIGSQQEFFNNVGDQTYLEYKEVIHVYDEECE